MGKIERGANYHTCYKASRYYRDAVSTLIKWYVLPGLSNFWEYVSKDEREPFLNDKKYQNAVIAKGDGAEGDQPVEQVPGSSTTKKEYAQLSHLCLGFPIRPPTLLSPSRLQLASLLIQSSILILRFVARNSFCREQSLYMTRWFCAIWCCYSYI